MRRLLALLGFVGVGIALPSLPACSDDEKSGIMLAISTDMLAPKDVNAVGVTVSTDGKIKFNVVGRVTPEGEVLLPATLAIAEPDDPNATIGIRVVAFQSNKARVMRDVQTSIPKGGRIALLRIPLNFANDGSVNGTLPDGVLPAPLTTSSLGSSLLSPRDFGTSTGYDPTVFAPNCPEANQTWVAGQCVDSYVAWNSLPTYTPESVGRANDTATCFDTYGCFAGSTVIPESGDDGVVLDRASCSLVLHGADPSKLNVAFLTASTGACIQSGSCYVPLDHGAAGWTESADRVQLPAYACKLTPASASLVLSPSTTCGAKTESRAACAAAAPVIDGGASVQNPLVSAEDFPASITIEPGSRLLDSAGSTRVAQIDLDTGAATALTIPASKKPWKFGSTRTGALLTDGTVTGYAIVPGGATPITMSTNGHDVAEMTAGRLWTVGGPNSNFEYSASAATATTTSSFPSSRVVRPNAILAMGGDVYFAGTTLGIANACTLTGSMTATCFANDTQLNPAAIVDALAIDPSSNGLGAWALTQAGIFHLLSNGSTAMTAEQVITDPFTGPVDGGVYLRHAIAGAGRCVIYSDPLGVEWRINDGGGKTHGGLLARGPDPRPTLGVAVDGTSVYYSVYAAASDGGGIFRAALPAECTAR